jgi:low temperature requirement protein LtrA
MLLRMIHPSEEGARVTTFELFFDLVFVFAFTQVTRLMAETHTGFGVLQALIVLALLWWCWVSYGWLTNQTRADRGIIRIGIILATIAIFVIALSIPEAFDDREGNLDAPVVLVVCYLLVRIIHGVLYFLAAGDDRALKRQVLVTVPAAVVPAGFLLFLGIAVGDPGQTWLWLAALLVDAAIVYATSRIGWRIHSAAHWAERHGLIVILALGESVVSIGAGVARLPLSVPIVLGSALAVLVSFGMWWAYFERMAPGAEKVLAHREGRQRTSLARDAYTYLHYPLIAGIIIAALGVELAMEHVAEPEPLGAFGGFALGVGVAVYLMTTFFFWWRVTGRRAWPRLASAVLFFAVSPLLSAIPGLAALVVAGTALAIVIVVERLAFRESRRPLG